jgi:hypothetical protein
MQDLLYIGTDFSIKKLVMAKYPTIKVNEVYDNVHEYRLEVEDSDITDKEWYGFLIKNCLDPISFKFQCAIRCDENIPIFCEVLDTLKKDEVIGHGS